MNSAYGIVLRTGKMLNTGGRKMKTKTRKEIYQLTFMATSEIQPVSTCLISNLPLLETVDQI